ncbi:MAG: QacE family quaternary ammonium compound efflux SMR transporter [Rhodobacteraceae bacterium]|uniref:DMT family transporter n=1 Tax=Celeribacter sp. HF31 TaxID=2721558 RepID=UPI001431BE97|nr:SMR family transporter [Celeribacter sp. HF31]NIY77903.1 QacE family quaternary ammonium compound efflux SMR transporter [Celeribacter sp. HF31]NVK45561.1 QacE family quaternary ammonium compound efflux SMR transporter [Paracoccaceae bacterium]
MAWILVVVAGLLEAIWATTMKYSNGFTLFWPSVATVLTMLVSFFMLSVAMKTLPLGPSYMVWVGIGALGAFIAGIVLHGEALSLTRVAAAGLIVAGMALMKLSA